MIWHLDGQFIYVGMSGRAIMRDAAIRGRRSGDQFCVCVADRPVLPTLTQADIASIAAGEHQMDAFVRRFIHENLSYRFVVVPEGVTAESSIKAGDWEYGKPFLNP
jgi:hypothetical protein